MPKSGVGQLFSSVSAAFLSEAGNYAKKGRVEAEHSRRAEEEPLPSGEP